MRQNRSSISSKGQRSKTTQINLLKNDLMSKINGFQQTKSNFRPSMTSKTTNNKFYSQLQDIQTISFDKQKKNSLQPQKQKSILQKAKQITRTNRDQIQKVKRFYKKSNPQNNQMFLTGCGLYKAQQQEKMQDFQSVDLNDALKFLVSHQKDDLQQLRRMINKTSFDIRQYTQQVTKTTSQVQSAADLFGRQFNYDLRLKVNKCKPIEKYLLNKNPYEAIQTRKISTSGKSRNKSKN